VKKLVVISVLMLSTAAVAQTPQPPQQAPEYVPIIVPKEDYDGVMEYLQKQPWAVAQPLIQWLTRMQSQAQMQARATKAAQEKAAQDAAPKKD
jgi:hypothetical protein